MDAAPFDAGPPVVTDGIWLGAEEIAALPMSGDGWDELEAVATGTWGTADVADQDNNHDVAAFAGALYAGWEQRAFVLPDGRTWAMLAAIAGLGACAYASLMKAMRTGAVASVTPFRYSRLLFGVALGVILFDERVDLAMASGCGVVVASGLFILWRSRRRAG